MDFFDVNCQEPPVQHTLFGICDDLNGGNSFTDITDQSKWIATVKNDSAKSLTFTAIDKCVIKDYQEKGRGRCDGMLTSNTQLYLVELKEVSSPSWQTGAINQLTSTIDFLNQHHNISRFRHKKAFACNKKRSRFQEIDNEFNLAFYRKYGFRIDIQADIIIT